MALVQVSWSELKEYSAEVEVDGFDENTSQQELRDAISDLSSEAIDDAEVGTNPIEIEEFKIVRAGDEPITVIAPRKVYEEDF